MPADVLVSLRNIAAFTDTPTAEIIRFLMQLAIVFQLPLANWAPPFDTYFTSFTLYVSKRNIDAFARAAQVRNTTPDILLARLAMLYIAKIDYHKCYPYYAITTTTPLEALVYGNEDSTT